MDYPPDNFDEYLITFNWWHSFKSKLDRYYAVLLVDKLENTPAYVICKFHPKLIVIIFIYTWKVDYNDQTSAQSDISSGNLSRYLHLI